MARNPINPDIGEILCPLCNKLAPVRKDRNGKLYYVSKAGMIKPNLPAGQDWLLNNAVIWPHGVKPVAITEPFNIQPELVNESKQQDVPVNESKPLPVPPMVESPLQRISRVLIG
ncbi:hypothetical protein [Shewanella sp. YLB-07]|uniref:hypothetical protein n=1 Tax=Shewanella sp. YLB-07 TaxID=2601268 RepID=UPI00128C3E50|nr:hypothetical protein [Shewanella sp. YLB-07]MPY23913.1 hypothetical protein [Shewanella sp. YLB-07]